LADVDAIVRGLERQLGRISDPSLQLLAEARRLAGQLRKARDVIRHYRERKQPTEAELFIAEPLSRMGILLPMVDRAARRASPDVALARELERAVGVAGDDLRTRTPRPPPKAWMITNLNSAAPALASVRRWRAEVESPDLREVHVACLHQETELIREHGEVRVERLAELALWAGELDQRELVIELEALCIEAKAKASKPSDEYMDYLMVHARRCEEVFRADFAGRVLATVDGELLGRLADRVGSALLCANALRYPNSGVRVLSASFEKQRRQLRDLLTNVEKNEQHAVAGERRVAAALRTSE